MEWIARALLVTIVASLITSSIGVAPVVAASPPAVSDPVSPATITPEALKAANAVASPPAPSASPVVVGSCAGTLFEENDQAVAYMWGSGRGWTEWSDPAASAGHYIADDPQLFASGPSGATATFYFTGNCVSWIYIATPYSASISVTIDGVLFEQISTYSSAGYVYGQSRSYQLADSGSHAIELRTTGWGRTWQVWDTDCHCWDTSGQGIRLFLDGFIAPAAGCTMTSFTVSPDMATETYGTVTLAAAATCGPSAPGLDYLFEVQDPQTGTWSVIADECGGTYTPGQTAWYGTVVHTDPPYTLRARAKIRGYGCGPVHVVAEALRTHGVTGTENHTGFLFGDSPHFAISPLGVNLATGAFTLKTEDLALPGRILRFSFVRFYNGTDQTGGPLGPSWTHSYNWAVIGDWHSGLLTLRRGDGWQDVYGYNCCGPSCFYHVANQSIAPDYAAAGEICVGATGTFTLTYPNQIKYDFDSGGRLTAVREPAGNRVALAYVGANLTQITDTAGRVITLTYDGAGRISQLTDPLGRHVSYGYDTLGRLSSVTDMTGGLWRYGYQVDTRRIASLTDPDGRRRVLNSYDDTTRVTRQQEQDGQVTTYAYGASTTMTNPRGTVSTWSADGRGRFLSQTQSGLTTSATYDLNWNRRSLTDRRGNTATWTYDAAGNVIAETQPAVGGVNPVWHYDRDAQNNVIRTTDPLGNVTTRTFDATKNVLLAEVRLSDNATTSYEYADTANPGLATASVLPRGGRTTWAYNADGTLRQKTEPDGAITTYTYDAAGRQLTMVDPDGNVPGGTPSLHTWTTEYDNLDRVTRTTDPLGNTRRFSYDSYGIKTAVTDARGNTTTYGYDGRGLLSSVVQSPSVGVTYTTSLTRDPNGNPTRITQANGVLTDYGYDPLDRLVAVTTHPSAAAQSTGYTLDANGNLTLKTLADGTQITFTYDTLNRLTSLSAYGLAQSFAYDLLGHRTAASQTVSGVTESWNYAYDAAGRMTSATGPTGSVTYTYDLDSNRTTITTTIGGLPHQVTYALSLGGRIQSVSEQGRTSAYTYTASGKPLDVLLPNGLKRTWTYDRAQRLIRVTNDVGGTFVSTHDYTLDPEGNRTGLSEEVAGITPPATTDGFSFSYDGLNRLTQMTGPRNESFTFDGASNITARTGPVANYGIDGANRHISDGTRSFTWSNTDRLTGRGGDAFVYDSLDRLLSATVASGPTTTYAYDADGLLQSRAASSVSTNFLWDPASSPQRLLVAGADRIVYGTGPLYVVRGTSFDLIAFARDGQGSVRAEVDAAGTVTGSWRYSLYGEIAQSNGQAAPSVLAYTGQLLDQSGLYFLRARWYDPATGRFMSRDPAQGGQPETMNAFGYANGNPFLLDDPAGRAAAQGGDDVAYINGLEVTKEQFEALVLAEHEGRTSAADRDCRGVADCAYLSEGVLIIQNTTGSLRALMDVYTLWQGDTVTLGPTLILSHGLVPLGSDHYRHEMGHVAQAKDLGATYVATYAAEWLYEAVRHGPGEAYKYHLMEIDANRRARPRLPDFWHVSH